MEWLEKAFEWALRLCYDLCGNFGWAVIIFTLLTKIILLPLSVIAASRPSYCAWDRWK